MSATYQSLSASGPSENLIAQLGGSGEAISKAHLLVALLRCGVRESSPLFAPGKRLLCALALAADC